jgi:hypothetical protein
MAVLFVLLTTFFPRSALAAFSFSPEFYFYLACGAASSISFQSDSPTRTFVPDSSYLSPSPSPAPAAYSSNPTPASPLYDAARADTSAFSYRFPYPASQSRDASSFVVLRLHFFPFVPASSQPVASFSSARFNVSVLDDAYALMSFFSPPAAGVVKEFFVPRGGVGHGDFTIKFTPENGSSAFVNALELFQAPPELLWNNSVTPVGAVWSNDLALWQQQPLETVYVPTQRRRPKGEQGERHAVAYVAARRALPRRCRRAVCGEQHLWPHRVHRIHVQRGTGHRVQDATSRRPLPLRTSLRRTNRA